MTWPTFHVYGPDIPAPLGCPAPAEPDRIARAVAWAAVIDQAIRDEDAWGILLTNPNDDLRLYGVEPRASLASHLLDYNARGCRLIRPHPGWDSPTATSAHAWVRTYASDGRYCALCRQPEATWTGQPCPGPGPHPAHEHQPGRPIPNTPAGYACSHCLGPVIDHHCTWCGHTYQQP